MDSSVLKKTDLVHKAVAPRPHLSLVVDNELPESDITYEVTTDPDYLQQYYALREECYRNDLGLENFSGAEDEYDRVGVIAIARKGDKVIGGARMVMSLPGKPIKLPLEEDDFMMKELFPELGLGEVGYVETGRFAIKSDFRKNSVNLRISSLLFKLARAKKCNYHFSISARGQARNHRLTLHKLGLYHEIDIPVSVPKRPIYGNINVQGMVLSVTYLDSNAKRINIRGLRNEDMREQKMVA